MRPLLLTVTVLALSACSSAIGSTPSVGEATPSTTEPSTTTPDTTTPDATTVPDRPTTAPSSTVDLPTTPPSGPDETVAEEPGEPTAPAGATTVPVTPPDPPIVAVWQEDGPDTQRAQEHLYSLGFWLAEANGEYGQTTTQAVMAFQKYAGLTADGRLGPQTADALNAVTERPTGRSTGGTLVEVDKTRQLLFIVRDGRTEWVLNTSTGTEIPYREPDQNSPGEFIEDDSITRTGVFAVNRQREEGWWEGDLGEIYRPKYFDGGIALHGSYNIPPYPASHGCVRLSIQAMDWIWAEDVVPMRTTVWVHGEIPPRDV